MENLNTHNKKLQHESTQTVRNTEHKISWLSTIKGWFTPSTSFRAKMSWLAMQIISLFSALKRLINKEPIPPSPHDFVPSKSISRDDLISGLKVQLDPTQQTTASENAKIDPQFLLDKRKVWCDIINEELQKLSNLLSTQNNNKLSREAQEVLSILKSGQLTTVDKRVSLVQQFIRKIPAYPMLQRAITLLISMDSTMESLTQMSLHNDKLQRYINNSAKTTYKTPSSIDTPADLAREIALIFKREKRPAQLANMAQCEANAYVCDLNALIATIVADTDRMFGNESSVDKKDIDICKARALQYRDEAKKQKASIDLSDAAVIVLEYTVQFNNWSPLGLPSNLGWIFFKHVNNPKNLKAFQHKIEQHGQDYLPKLGQEIIKKLQHKYGDKNPIVQTTQDILKNLKIAMPDALFKITRDAYESERSPPKYN